MDAESEAFPTMMNMYDEIRSDLRFQRFEIGESLFVEYTCPIEDERAGIWTQRDSFLFVLDGKKTWRTPQGSWTAEKGQSLYIKKGASIIEQHMDEDFCVLLIFLSDAFIRDSVREVAGEIPTTAQADEGAARAFSVDCDVSMSAYFQSMITFFSGDHQPSDALLALKLKELIFSVLLNDRNPELAAYFRFLSGAGAPSIRQIMEANFCFNLSLEEYARLCHRSLSSFKRDFKAIYQTSPGRWLLEKRLDYAALKLSNPELQITEVAFECGFENLSHFSRSFKRKFGPSPAGFRKSLVESG